MSFFVQSSDAAIMELLRWLSGLKLSGCCPEYCHRELVLGKQINLLDAGFRCDFLPSVYLEQGAVPQRQAIPLSFL
jgi:hypothetical protein